MAHAGPHDVPAALPFKERAAGVLEVRYAVRAAAADLARASSK
jgi:hypothetical protein